MTSYPYEVGDVTSTMGMPLLTLKLSRGCSLCLIDISALIWLLFSAYNTYDAGNDEAYEKLLSNQVNCLCEAACWGYGVKGSFTVCELEIGISRT